MPTGSLCAERNVIGSALASDLTLKREDIQYVAVLSLSLENPHPPDKTNQRRNKNINSLANNGNDNNGQDEGDENDTSNHNNNDNNNNVEATSLLSNETLDDSVSLFALPITPFTPQISTQSEPPPIPRQSPSTPPSRPSHMKRAMSQPIVPSYQPGTTPASGSGSGSSTPSKTKMVTVFDVPRQSALFTPSSLIPSESRYDELLTTCKSNTCQNHKTLHSLDEVYYQLFYLDQ